MQTFVLSNITRKGLFKLIQQFLLTFNNKVQNMILNIQTAIKNIYYLVTRNSVILCITQTNILIRNFWKQKV